MAANVVVYAPDGARETHSRLNARDLVLHSGWTYSPGKTYTPVDSAPYIMDSHKAPTASKAQEVLDRYGAGPNAGEVLAAPPADTSVFDAGPGVAVPPTEPAYVAPAPEPVVEPESVIEPELVPEEAVTDEPEPVVEEEPAIEDAPTTTRRRGRPPKSGL